ncbi:lytic murein transglycosylase, partial [Achromobacter sp. ACM03]|nr:lytic murein transglycosylase [Achromobacter sp. ACM03]
MRQRSVRLRIDTFSRVLLAAAFAAAAAGAAQAQGPASATGSRAQPSVPVQTLPALTPKRSFDDAPAPAATAPAAPADDRAGQVLPPRSAAPAPASLP